MKLGLVAFAVAVPSLAAASPQVTAGVGLGLTQQKVDSESTDANHTLDVYGRIALTSRIAGQIELSRMSTPNDTTDIRGISGLMIVELASNSRLMPLIMAGIGWDHEGQSYGSREAHHIEGGFGLEYRVDGGFTIGAQFRLGGRSIDSDDTVYPLQYDRTGTIALYEPSGLRAGEYRSLGLYAGVRF
jgi:hypothetical protein